MQIDALKILGEILRREMGLKDDQTVIANQEFRIPSDERLYLSVALLGGKTFGVSTRYEADPVTGELKESQGANRQEIVSILAYSKGSEARIRNWEIPVALKSTFSQQLQEKHSFHIGNVPTSMNDVSANEGAARLNRYSMTINLLVAYRKEAPVDYFTEFQTPQFITNP